MNWEKVWGRVLLGWVIALCLWLIAALIVVPIYSAVNGPHYEFRDEVGAHIDNAREARSPELIHQELQRAIAGMERLGLEDQMCGSVFQFKCTPQHKMAWEYDRLGAILERIDEIIEWRDNYHTGSQVSDVYTEKVNAVRAAIGCWEPSPEECNEVAYRAYRLNITPGFYWFYLSSLIGIPVGAVGAAATAMICANRYNW